MKLKTAAFALLLLGNTLTAEASSREGHTVARGEIVNGYVVKKVWLERYAVPAVQLLESRYGKAAAGTKVPATAAGLKVMLGMERKRPFAIISIPAYRVRGTDTEQLTDFVLDVAETPGPVNTATAARTTAASSVLASGTWHKIAVQEKGIYKVDYNFLSSKLGLSGSISSANIRLYGNGGTMLSEANSAPRAEDLVENAIQVEDGGDGVFGQGDYFLFYANGPMAWDKDSLGKGFVHRKNLYEDKSYYFVNVDLGPGKRLASAASASGANTTVSSYNDYHVVEDDKVSVGKFGKEWWGDEFSQVSSQALSRNYNFDLGQGGDSVHLRVMVGARNAGGTETFTVSMNGQFLETLYTSFPGNADNYPVRSRVLDTKRPAAGNVSIQIDLQTFTMESKGYLNYIEINNRRSLTLSGGQTAFRDWKSTGPGKIAEYKVGNANGNVAVWDVTDPLTPLRINGSLNGTEYVFARNAASLHEFIAFDGSSFRSPEYIGRVDNQNLHGLGQTDYLIVSDKTFLSAANRLADFHRQKGLRVEVVMPQQIYNEFSSGGQDLSAIRDFAKMFYDRAGSNEAEMPKYLLLFGDASIDYKNRLTANTNFVPTFESSESEITLNGYCTDDFFGFLDNNEDIEDYSVYNTLDLGMGRFPVKNETEADDIVNKILHYTSPASLGPWRLAATYVADNEDGAGDHLDDGENWAFRTVDSASDLYNSTKVYLDNMPFVSTPGGDRAPEANKIINNQVYKGNFIINYNGHGNIYTLADERVLTADDFNNWKNYDALPIIVTATCDFSQFDRPDFVSAGEKLILKNDGGTIAMLTTTQAVYSFGSKVINKAFLKAQFNKDADGKWRTFGKAFMVGKNETYESVTDPSTLLNFRKFTLLGDPALVPAFPQHRVSTDSVLDLNGGVASDTLKALGKYTIKASVRDGSGTLLNQFNGNAYVTIYDKPRVVDILSKNNSIHHVYNIQDNIIYKGRATVTNGAFSVSFIVPKDINYDMGSGKISYYVENGEVDGAGTDSAIHVGGFTDNAIADNKPPIVRPYIGDSLFRDGGLTGTNTLLYAILEDESGINASGNGVGHDITAVLDDDVQNPFILNDYYETEPNSFRRGVVQFPVTGLADGMHSLRVKAWDVYNNSGEGTVRFEVANGQVTKVANLMNYPNPFSTLTHFVFEHNHPEELLKVQINIYSTAGMLVRSLSQQFTPGGSRSNEITWDGTDNNGARLPSGVYPYRFILSTQKGSQVTAYQKLVLIR